MSCYYFENLIFSVTGFICEGTWNADNAGADAAQYRWATRAVRAVPHVLNVADPEQVLRGLAQRRKRFVVGARLRLRCRDPLRGIDQSVTWIGRGASAKIESLGLMK